MASVEEDAQAVNVKVIQVPLVNQRHRWDCGVACMSMVFGFLGLPQVDVYQNDLIDLGCGESVWTIDLALTLHRHHVALTFTTLVLGVNTNHSKKLFYKSNFCESEKRVTEMFEVASQKGISIEQRSVGESELLSHLSHGLPVIVLVDWSRMGCLGCDSAMSRLWSFVTCDRGPYQGHYIVLCGFDAEERIFYFKNPDSKNHDTCSVPMDTFDDARRSDGTDQDILFIHGLTQTESRS